MINNFGKNHENNIHPSVIIEPSAIIDRGAIIGANTKIWHWVHICSDAKIGKNCSLGQNVFIANKVKIGDNFDGWKVYAIEKEKIFVTNGIKREVLRNPG